MSTKSDFLEWKSHPMTKKVFEALQERESGLKDRLALSAGEDVLQDRYHVGYLAALRDFYLIDVEEVSE